MRIETFDLPAKLHMRVLRLAARTGHIRRAARVVGWLFPSGTTALVHFDIGGVLVVDQLDPYWARILVGWEHEPEVRRVLDTAVTHRPDATLYDCGANIGYWAVRYAHRVPVVAVEAVLPTYQRLAANAARNGFQAVHAAVWDTSGQSLTIHWGTAGEAAASVTDRHGAKSSAVDSVTLDDLAGESSRAPIVKLDVEGAELQAIDGAAKLRNQALWVYEDHGKELTHKVTARFLELGFQVRYAGDEFGRPIIALGQLDQIKINPSQGYNFVALRPDGPWAGLI